MAAYLRTHLPWPPHDPVAPAAGAPINSVRPLDTRAADAEVALTCLGVLGQERPVGWLNVSYTDLRRADCDRTVAERCQPRRHVPGSRKRIQVNLRGASLITANLRHAELGTSILHRARLTGADLRGARLLKADLREANFSGADLREANVRKARAAGAVAGRLRCRGGGRCPRRGPGH